MKKKMANLEAKHSLIVFTFLCLVPISCNNSYSQDQVLPKQKEPEQIKQKPVDSFLVEKPKTKGDTMQNTFIKLVKEKKRKTAIVVQRMKTAEEQLEEYKLRTKVAEEKVRRLSNENANLRKAMLTVDKGRPNVYVFPALPDTGKTVSDTIPQKKRKGILKKIFNF